MRFYYICVQGQCKSCYNFRKVLQSLKGKSTNLTHLSLFRGLGEYRCMCWKKVIQSLLWLQMKLLVIWYIAPSEVFQWLSCIVGWYCLIVSCGLGAGPPPNWDHGCSEDEYQWCSWGFNHPQQSYAEEQIHAQNKQVVACLQSKR